MNSDDNNQWIRVSVALSWSPRCHFDITQAATAADTAAGKDTDTGATVSVLADGVNIYAARDTEWVQRLYELHAVTLAESRSRCVLNDQLSYLLVDCVGLESDKGGLCILSNTYDTIHVNICYCLLMTFLCTHQSRMSIVGVAIRLCWPELEAVHLGCRYRSRTGGRS